MLVYKKLIVFDLDGTLAASKQPIDTDMSQKLLELLQIMPVAVISGGDWPQFQKQLVGQLTQSSILTNLYLLPTSGTKFYRYKKTWTPLYVEYFSEEEKQKVKAALAQVILETALTTERVWGDQIEDRGSQITFSGLGQLAPGHLKANWDLDVQKRINLKSMLDEILPDFAVRIGGTSSIDITRSGIDKAYGIHKLATESGCDLSEMLFIGDALYPGGNDVPVRDIGVKTIAVNNISETKLIIETIIKLYS